MMKNNIQVICILLIKNKFNILTIILQKPQTCDAQVYETPVNDPMCKAKRVNYIAPVNMRNVTRSG